METAIDELKRGKAPGPDGMGSDLYRMYKNKVAPFLFLVFEESFKNGALPKTFTRTHTILIPKSEDPLKRQSVTGYRPITLANTDYKILMKIIAKRLQSVISMIVGPHQTCGIKGRSIVTNIHVARSVLQCCDMFFS